MRGHQREGEVAHEGVDLGVEHLLVQQVKVAEPIAAPHHVLKAGVPELCREIVLKHACK